MLLDFLVLLILLLIIFYNKYLNKEPLSPPIVFSISIWISCFAAIFYKEFYYLNLCDDTFFTILCGVSTFYLGYILYGYYYKKRNKFLFLSPPNRYEIFINKKGYYILLVVNVLTVLLTYDFLMKVSSAYGGMTLSERILAYRISYMFNENLSPDDLIPWYTNVLHDISYAGVLWLGYRWINNFMVTSKVVDYKFFVIASLYIASSLLSGGRGNIVYVFLSLAVIYYILKMREMNWRCSFSVVQIFKGIFWSAIGLVLFFLSTILIGRGGAIVDIDTFFYELYLGLGVYIAAPIKLLDIFISEEYILDHGMPVGFYTFNHIYHWLGLHLGIKEWYQFSDFGFRSVNGVFLGNVYTTFKPYYQDFGLVGVCVLCMFMGSLFAYIYYRIKYTQENLNYISQDVWIILYAFMFYSLALAFFYNWFYEYFFDIWFLKMMVYFYIVKRLLFTF